SPKKSRGKGSQGKKTADVSQELVDVSKVSEPEPAKKKTSSRSTRGVVIQDPPSTLNPKLAALKVKLKGVQYLTPEEQETMDTCGYHQKDKKRSQNDKTEHGMEKTVQNQGQSPNFDPVITGDHRKVQLNELNELRDHAYENSLIYKAI
ncbi:hypothetical protein Tco_0262726, partial [Tanacetum coccineum]